MVAWQAVAGFGLPAQHHDDVVGPVSVDALWLRLLTVAALVLVAAFALLRPFVGTPSTRSRWVVVAAATVAVVGELAMTRTGAGRLDAAAGVLPVVLVTGALAALMALDPGRRGRVSGFLPVVVGVLGLVLGTEPAAVGELLSGRWSGAALRASALVWVAALAWFALDGPERPFEHNSKVRPTSVGNAPHLGEDRPVGLFRIVLAVSRTAWVASAVVALAVVAALPGFTAVRGQDAAMGHMVQTTWTSGT